ncbi:MAG: helix-turn-helix domain-containing protein [Desulfovibrionaceae bacterium]|nr:helix-turn-helix domain-containing protein [Desulfovibrionaceae bacterium]
MSRHLGRALEMARDIHEAGGMSPITLRQIESLCLPPRREFHAADVKRIRESAHLSQAVFAALLNVGLSTVQQWEMGRKKPSGPSAKLLDLLERKGMECLV